MSAQACPACGALNAADAAWCGQCLTRFGAPPNVAAPSAPPQLRAVEPAPVRAGPVQRRGETLVWQCPACETDNPIDNTICAVCGTPMTAIFSSDAPPAPARAGGAALALSVAFPGAGHLWARRWGDAMARIVTFGWAAGVGWWLASRHAAYVSNGIVHAVGWMLLIVAAGIWTLTLVEGQRLARGDATPLLPVRAFMWGMLGLVMLLFFALIGGATVRT